MATRIEQLEAQAAANATEIANVKQTAADEKAEVAEKIAAQQTQIDAQAATIAELQAAIEEGGTPERQLALLATLQQQNTDIKGAADEVENIVDSGPAPEEPEPTL